MDLNILGSLTKTRGKEWEYFKYLMDKFTQEIGKMTTFKDLELTFILMDKDTKVNCLRERGMVKDYFSIPMALIMMDNGKMIKSTETDSKTFPTVAFIQASGAITKETEKVQ